LYSVAGTTEEITRVTRESGVSSTYAAGDEHGYGDVRLDTCLGCGSLLTADTAVIATGLGRVASKLVADYCVECALV
jgi:hypothetical protein